MLSVVEMISHTKITFVWDQLLVSITITITILYPLSQIMMDMVMAAVMEEEEIMVESQWNLEILRLQANQNNISASIWIAEDGLAQ